MRMGWMVMALLCMVAICDAAPVLERLVPALGWDGKKQGGFPVSLAADAGGNVWVGTEGNGVWKYEPGKKVWTQFTTKDGLGDDCVYALAVDALNRVWAGHLNHGVSVYNGREWKNYGFIDGPLGDRVFAMAVSPKDGDVWMATDMGLARYSEKRRDWDYYTRASGLPSDQIACIAFDGNGTLYAGTQSAGIVMASGSDNYAKWQTVSTQATAPQAAMGVGLASNLINTILPVRNLITAYSPSGISATTGGRIWRYIVPTEIKNIVNVSMAGGTPIPQFPRELDHGD